MSRDNGAVSSDHQHHYRPPPPGQRYPPPQMGTFAVVSNNSSALQPVPPPVAGDQAYSPGEVCDEDEEPPRFACRPGVGWFLFKLGFFGIVAWYVGAIILLCVKVDRREKPGLIACTIGAAVITILGIIAVVATVATRNK